jgi:hypothetical protein
MIVKPESCFYSGFGKMMHAVAYGFFEPGCKNWPSIYFWIVPESFHEPLAMCFCKYPGHENELIGDCGFEFCKRWGICLRIDP